jgi:AhpD family alkylhydroperoxidase
MRTGEQKLSSQQRELVAVGASVGAGCHPCVSYHIKAATKAGVTGERLLAALASSERVAAEAAERMTVHARGQLATEVTAPAAASPLDDALASFGGALAANDLVNIERHLRAAAELGASHAQLDDAIATAQKVQENATRIHVREAQRLLEQSTGPAAPVADQDGGCDDDCPCHADDTAEEPSVASQPATDPDGQTSGGCAEATAGAQSD